MQPFHFPIMIIASVAVFVLVIRIVLPADSLKAHKREVLVLCLVVVVLGMLLGKFGANLGMPWWIYYPVPMLMNVLLPPAVLKMNRRQTIIYLLLGFLSAPFIHAFFSFFFGWNEYMPFWTVPSISSFF